MVDAGKITLRIEVDAKEFQRLMKGSTKDLSKFKQEVDKTEPSMKKLGDSATTTAVRFQTLTQGTINLVTSFTQAYTSISNLQKAKTSLQAAAVGVERAIDLQRRKQFMLNEEMAKAAPNMKKVELLTNELATAHDDLAVKQQRVKDQADQVNDTYILFALNITNVGFSAVQTGVSMAKMAQGVKLATIASTAFNAVTSKYTIIALTAIAAWEGLSMVIRIFNKDLGESMSIISNVTKLMDQFTGASDITLDHYDDKIGGVTQSTTEFENSWKSMTSTVKKETNEQSRLVFAWRQHYREQINNMKMDMAGLQQVSGIGGPQGNFPKAQQGIEAKVQKTEKKVDSLFDYIFPNVPSAHAETHIEQQIHKQDNNVFVPDPNLTQTIKLPGGSITVPANMQQQYAAQGGVFEYTTQEKADKLKAWKAKMLAEGKGDPERQKLLHYEPLPDILKPSKPSIFMQAYTTGKTVEQIKYEQEENRIQGKRFRILQEIEQVQNAMVQWQDDDGQLSPLLKQKFAGELARLDNQLIPLDNELFNLQNPSVTKPPVVGEPNAPVIPETERQRRKREHEEAKAARKNKMRYYTSVFKSKTKPKAISFRIGPDGRYSMIPTATAGVAYGGIGGLQIAMTQNRGGTFGIGGYNTRQGNMIEALRQAQMATIDPNATRRTNLPREGFFRNGEFVPYNQIAFDKARNVSGFDYNVSAGGTGYTQAAIAAGVSATALYQNVTVATPSHIRFANARKDSFNNSLGGLIMNELNSLKGSGRMVYSSAHRSLYKSRNFRVPGRDVIREAVRLGIKGNVEFMDAIKAIPDVDRQAENNIQQAYAAIRQAETIANDYISMVNSAKSSIGFTDSILRRATAEGHSGASMYANISLLSSTKRTNFSNTEIIEESKAKLALTNSQIFAIRFNATRGDTELQDRLRYVDQLEAMSSGTSPL